MSRNTILAAIKSNQFDPAELPDLSLLNKTMEEGEGLVSQYTLVASAGGTFVYEVTGHEAIKKILQNEFKPGVRIVSGISGIDSFLGLSGFENNQPHSFSDVELCILPSSLGVSENGALWLTEEQMGTRVLPFISQHLAIVINKNNLVPTMNHAYEIIGRADYGYGVFIAGPSKTADIEQSLVIGAHGPRSLSVFLIA